MTTAVSSPVTDAYLAELEVVTGRPIGDARKPKGQPNLYPYAVLYVGVTDTRGTLVDPHEDGLHRVQVTCVGQTRQSAEWLRDRCREVLHDVTVLIEGHAVTWTESAGSPPVRRDDDVTPTVFEAVEVVNVYVTPTPGS